jgi:hypothetical protein
MRRRRLACLACAALVVACGDDAGSEPEGDDDPTEEVTVAPEVLTIHPVLDEVPGPCDGVPTAAGQVAVQLEGPASPCLVLGSAEVDATMVEDAGLTSDGGDVAVAVQLDDEGTAALNAMAESAFVEQGKLAIVVDGELVSAVPVVEPQSSGSVAVTGLTVDEAVALVAALGGDATMPEPGDPDLDRASAVCEAFRPDVPGVAIATTAGSVTTALGDDAVEPWASLPVDHFVARCGYPGPDTTDTTTCPDGSTVSLSPADQWLVDEEGRSTPDPTVLEPLTPCG